MTMKCPFRTKTVTEVLEPNKRKAETVEFAECLGYDAIERLDVEVVKHGRWIEQTISGEQTWCCSACKTLGSPHWKRCPVCEAKMNGGKENEIE